MPPPRAQHCTLAVGASAHGKGFRCHRVSLGTFSGKQEGDILDSAVFLCDSRGRWTPGPRGAPPQLGQWAWPGHPASPVLLLPPWVPQAHHCLTPSPF